MPENGLKQPPEMLPKKQWPDQQAAKIHWRLCQGGENPGDSSGQRTRQAMAANSASAQPDLSHQVAFAREAEQLGFDSLLVDFGLNKPDPTLLAMAIGLQTETIKFIIACRSGIMSPTLFVQQLNTLSHVITNRFSLNVVAGHSPQEQQAYGDWMDHDQRYARTSEYLGICQQLWLKPSNTSADNSSDNYSHNGEHYQLNNSKVQTHFCPPNQRPECFIAGSSPQALALAGNFGDIWVSLAQLPEVMAPQVQAMVASGTKVAIRLSVICRDTKAQAIKAAEQLIATTANQVEGNFVQKSDSFGIKRALQHAQSASSPWLSDCLWTGAVKSHGAPSIALVGDAEQIAAAIGEYQAIGVSQFIFSGWPQHDEMRIFGQQVLPLLKQQRRN